jgi:cell division protein FtsN
VVIIILALLIGIGTVIYFNDTMREDFLALFKSTEETQPVILQKEEPDTVAMAKTATDPYANCTEFHIIAGSFREQGNASELKRSLELKGYNPSIITSNENFFRVSMEMFDDREKALDKLQQMKSTAEWGHVWLLSI